MDDIAAQFSFASPDDRPLRRLLIRSIERLTGQRDFVSLYRQNRVNPVPGENFFEAALRLLRLELDGDLTRLGLVPRSGPVIFVANHPYGVLDGIAACVLAGRARPDFRILINAMLVGPEEMKPYSLPIDFSETPEALQNNLRTRAEARRHLASGGALLLFPGGTVSTRISPFHRGPAGDPAWKPFVVQLAQRGGATVVPVFFEGENSWMFHAASHLSVTLRLALLFHEVHARMGTAIGVKIGDPVAASSLDGASGRFDAAQQLRALTYALGGMAPPRQYGPRLSRRLGLEVPEEWASIDALGRLKAAY